jgi:hypothetical protein
MRRLLQLGTLLFVLSTILVPVAEFFDRWDAPGISNDTEFAFFALVLMICLLLLVSKLVSSLDLRMHLVTMPFVLDAVRWLTVELEGSFATPGLPANLIPLRI